jgi:mono/diheme cytochrome c family protein
MKKLWYMGAAMAVVAGCYAMRPSDGGGETDAPAAREVMAGDVALPAGYRIEPVVVGLNFPSAVVLDDQDRTYVVECGYSYGEAFAKPRILRIDSNGGRTVIASSNDKGAWTGATFHDGAFYVSESREMLDSRILRVTLDGKITPIVGGLPPIVDHHTNGPVVRDGYLYFAQGVVTNSGVVGEDNHKIGWLERHPQVHDIPGEDIVLAGRNFKSKNPLTTDDDGDEVETGAYAPFGMKTREGQVIRGRVPCTGAVMRVPLAGGNVELVAWGLRNPFGLAFSPDGRLFATENGYDTRGSRPVFGAPDNLWEIRPGTWYGWPDFVSGMPVEWERFKRPGYPQPSFVLAKHPGKPPEPAARLACHASVCGIDFSRSERFGFAGEAFIAQFGDMAPSTAKVLDPVGFSVVRVNPKTGAVHDFIVNRSTKRGPASKLGTRGIERPIDVQFDREGTTLYVLDFGVMTMSRTAAEPQKQTGVLWRVTRAPAGVATGSPVQSVVARNAGERRGEHVFMSQCYHCHPGGGTGLAPGFTDLPLPAGMMKAQTRLGAGAMPHFSEHAISDEDLDALGAYLKALRAADMREEDARE